MTKINGNIMLKCDDSSLNNCINIKGFLNNNRLFYKENDILVTLNIFNNKIIMKRKTKDYLLTLSLEENKITKNKYNIKNIGNFIISIKTLKLIIDNNYINIEYLVIDSNENFSYEIKYDLLEETL